MSDYITHVESSQSVVPRNDVLDGMFDIKELMLKNQRIFLRDSPYLDSLLVFAGLFSAILAAFLIEVRKGLQEDLLQDILQELRKSDDPFVPSTISVWVNGLWFASLSISLASALFVILAKAMGRRVLGKEEIRAIFGNHVQSPAQGAHQKSESEWSSSSSSAAAAAAAHAPLLMRGGSDAEIWKLHRRTGAHRAFKRKFEFLTMSATIAISMSLTLFYPGLVVLIYETQKGIGISVAAIACGTAVFTFACVLHDVWLAARLDPAVD